MASNLHLKNNKLKTALKILYYVFASYFAVCVFACVFKMTSAGTFTAYFDGNGIFYLFMFAGLICIFQYLDKNCELKAATLIGALIFTVINCLSINLKFLTRIVPVFDGKYSVAVYIIYNLGVFVLYSYILRFAATFFSHCRLTQDKEPFKRRYLAGGPGSMPLTLLFLLLCWFPYYIAFWPGPGTSDSVNQLMQALGITSMTNHHPVLHTLFLRLCVSAGKALFGTVGAGIGIFTFVQMVLYALTVCYCASYMAYRRVHYGVRLAFIIFCAAYPVFGFYSIVEWKDAYMGIAVMLYTLAVYEIVTDTAGFFSKKSNIVLLCVLMLLMCYIKKTGFYIILASFPFLLFLKHKSAQIIILLLITIAGGFAGQKLLLKATGIPDGKSVEMLSVPLQQIGNIVTHYSDTLSAEQRDLLNKYIIDPQTIPDDYTPGLSDNMKGKLNKEYFEINKGDFVKLWFSLIDDHPLAALAATGLNAYGYVYPNIAGNVTGAHPYYILPESSLGPFDIYAADPTYSNSNDLNLLPGVRKFIKDMQWVKDSTRFIRNVPVVSMLFSCGFYFSVLLFYAVFICANKKYALLLTLLPAFASFLICVISPVNADFRYALPYVFSVIVLVPLLLRQRLIISKK